MRARRAQILVSGLAAALALGACSSPSDSVDALEREAADVTDSSSPPIERYVALGDSFTAGPLIPTTDITDGCFRSDGNYPALVADRLDVDRLVDVSCSGARTSDLTGPQPTVGGAKVPPQLKALTPGTDLVTVGIGGNDFNLFETFTRTCTLAGRGRTTGSPCADRLAEEGTDLGTVTEGISRNVEKALDRVKQRAPRARVLLVGYLRLAPADGRCPELPFAPGDYATGSEVSRALNEALATAAERADVGFVDMYAASEGHDICADEPWVNGAQTLQDQALAYHPFAAGMEAVADRIVERLDR
jgi:lysophospholipase L1-like esterase